MQNSYAMFPFTEVTDLKVNYDVEVTVLISRESYSTVILMHEVPCTDGKSYASNSRLS